MKKLFAILLLVGIAQFAFAQGDPLAKVVFTESQHDFGDIKQGDKVEWIFSFKNEGNAPLVLTNVSTTCGCTAPEWPREPIMPGEESKILVRFNSTGKMGRQNKVVTVFSNAANNPERVTIVANVLAQ
jgi:hypothetical protein